MDAYHMIDRLKKLGIEAQSIEQPIDFSEPENKMMLAMYLVMPEVDNDRRSIKIRGGIRAALKAGHWCRMAPYGYRNSRDANNRPIIIPNEHAAEIRKAFETVAKGIAQPVALFELNRTGVHVKKSRFSDMLKNPMYMGKIEVPASKDEPYLQVEGAHEGIVSEALFYQVQQVLNGHTPRKRISVSIKNDMLPLRGILRCSKCSGKITGSRSKSRNGTKHAYYHCNHCHAERYRAEAANSTITEILDGFILSQPSKIIYQELVKRLLKGDENARKTNAAALKQTIAKQEERIERLQDNLADGVITSEDFVQMKTRFIDLKRKAEMELSSELVDVSGKKLLLEQALEAISGLGMFYVKADSESKIQLLGSIFPEMLEFDGNKCRTTKINDALALCLSIDGHLSAQKNRTLPDKLEVSGWVGPTGFEPVTLCL
jgi:site-specific DNA recombinase